MRNNSNLPKDGLRTRKLVHLALPVRWSLIGQEGRGSAEVACTYDIHPQGARLVGSRDLNIGDLILVQRGRNKALCQVVWSADPASALRGQFTVQCVDGKTPWVEELQQTEEEFQPVILDGLDRRRSSVVVTRPDVSRRRRPRFYVEGQAEVMEGVQYVAGEVQQISEYGARLSLEQMRPGADFRLMLNLFDVSVVVTAQVKYLVDKVGMGVEFQQIRRGDRPLLDYVLSKLKSRRVEEFSKSESVGESIPAVNA